jgi:hypothetical protein
MSQDRERMTVGLDALLGVSAGVMIILTVLLLAILGLCQRGGVDKLSDVEQEEYKVERVESSKEEQPHTQTQIPKPPPMPKPPDKLHEQPESLSSSGGQRITFSPPVWLSEIQTNKLFNKVKLELAENSNEVIENRNENQNTIT